MEVHFLFFWIPFIALLCSFSIYGVHAIPSRLRRDHYHDDSRITQLPKCQVTCEATFRRDFHETFQKSYEADYFDFPVDPLISSSVDNFNSFCRLVNESVGCYRNDCSLTTEDTDSPRSYICVDKKADFERALNCLNKTSRQINCHTGCSRLARRSINSTEEEFETRGMIEADKLSFHEQNLRCRFQACAKECRNQLINNTCASDEKVHTLQTVHQYYISDLASDWREFLKDEKAHLFSRFCRRMLNDRKDELGSSSWKQQSYEKTMEQIREYASKSVNNC